MVDGRKTRSWPTPCGIIRVTALWMSSCIKVAYQFCAAPPLAVAKNRSRSGMVIVSVEGV